ncbi:hypothetical protein TNIN_396901 [Trichonephila inaurata madagascariensis]|uniref:Uncharacterized protein n=1 Tax=Trichonephila inaurata madagascariensis TaxID=2747483 RepID=A0A8X7CDU0_9ARAC|nr:hypothetical protein TNIN_396901 [Trichonephila inaurata madagascariensis]
MLDPNTAPVYRRDLKDVLFFCDFSSESKDCAITTNGTNKWEFASNLQGNFIRILLRGGESSTIFFEKPISPKKERFCLRIVMKMEPYYPYQHDESDLRLDVKSDDGMNEYPVYLSPYDPRYRNSYIPNDHSFSKKVKRSIIWAKTWRVGCGFTAFFDGATYTNGNVDDAPVYEPGEPGSACPINSCAGGKTCTGGNDYPGLCKMLNPNTAPVYRRNLTDLLFFCDFSPETKDCEPYRKGKKWNMHSQPARISLRGRESSPIYFKKHISPKRKYFCVRVLMKKESFYPNEPDESDLKADFIRENDEYGDPYTTMDLHVSDDPQFRTEFRTESLNLPWKKKTSVSIL